MKVFINKKGWGLSTELIFILIFVVGLFVAMIFANKFGILKNGTNDIYNDKIDNTDYKGMESIVLQATKKYVNNVYNNDIGENTLIVRISYLIKNGYLSELKDGNGKSCSGYISVINVSDISISYNPYIKCKNYETIGYEESNDW